MYGGGDPNEDEGRSDERNKGEDSNDRLLWHCWLTGTLINSEVSCRVDGFGRWRLIRLEEIARRPTVPLCLLVWWKARF